MNELDPIDTAHLQAFVEVVRYGSVTEAARALHRSQPAISHRLRLLEERCGVPLFDRVGRKLHPSEYGRRLYQECTGLLAGLRDLPQLIRGSSDEVHGEVSIGTFPTLGCHYLFDPITHLMQEHPQLRLRFRFGIADPMIEALHAGHLSFVVLVGEFELANIESQRLGEIRMCAAFAADADVPAVLQPNDLRARRYIEWSGPSDPTFDLVRQYALRLGLVDGATPSIPHIETLRALAASGLGYTIIPDYTAARDVAAGRLITRTLPEFSKSFPVYLLSRRDRSNGPAARTVREALIASY